VISDELVDEIGKNLAVVHADHLHRLGAAHEVRP